MAIKFLLGNLETMGQKVGVRDLATRPLSKAFLFCLKCYDLITVSANTYNSAQYYNRY